jgi:hypothetical protein
MIKTLMTAAIAATLAATSARAEQAPAALRGKSVVVTWNEMRIQRNVGEADFRTVQASHSMSLYISSVGRVFSRMTFATRAGSAARDQVSGSAPQSGGPARVPNFSGRTLTVYQPYRGVGGMRRVTIDFDESFGGCGAKVIHAKEQGKSSSIGFSPITKVYIEFKSASAAGETCAVKAGNVFGGEQ